MWDGFRFVCLFACLISTSINFPPLFSWWICKFHFPQPNISQVMMAFFSVVAVVVFLQTLKSIYSFPPPISPFSSSPFFWFSFSSLCYVGQQQNGGRGGKCQADSYNLQSKLYLFVCACNVGTHTNEARLAWSDCHLGVLIHFSPSPVNSVLWNWN